MELYIGGFAQGKLEYVKCRCKENQKTENFFVKVIDCADSHYKKMLLETECDILILNHLHLWVRDLLDEGMEVRYNDVRKFGRMKLVDHDDYKNQLPLSKLGPEPFEIDYLELYQKLKKKNKAIKTVLLDQSIMTGIGNIYANEICYQMHLNPYTKANVLSKKRVKELVDVACEILNMAILQGGTTIHSFSANGIDGLFQVQLKVHMQKHCPLGHEIKKVMINERGTYYCPICQKAKR